MQSNYFGNESGFYTPTQNKFSGYAQFPFQITHRNIPEFLLNSNSS